MSNNKQKKPDPIARMGTELRAEVTRQLLQDLLHYGITTSGLSLDWSEVCIEGSTLWYLDGEIDNYSGIGILDSNGDSIGYGWMDFVCERRASPLFVYWQYLTINNIDLKNTPGIPPHIWERLPRSTQKLYKKYRMPHTK